MTDFTDRRKATVTLYTGNFQAELNELAERALEAAKTAKASGPQRAGQKPKTEVDDLAAEYDAKVAEREASGVEVSLVEVSNMEWEELSEAHPPREDDDLDERAGFNRPAFQRALVEASVVEPKVDLKTMSRANYMKLVNAVTELHGADDAIPFVSLVSQLKQYRESDSRQQPASV